MYKELEPREFCQTWVPKIYKIDPGTKGKGKVSYRQACIDFLSYVCDASPKTVAFWIDYSPEQKKRRPNRYLLKYLRVIDVKLRDIEQTSSLYQQFIEDLKKNSKILE